MTAPAEPVDEPGDNAFVRRAGGSVPPRHWRSWFIGRPLATADAPHQTIPKRVGLAVFASDALSSTAYATQEILVILAVAGAAAFSLALPISIAIVVLLAIVTVSYIQTIFAYPNGGGSYIVTRDNLGATPAQVAGAAILTDYVLTVAVSISAGVAQITSAFPGLYDWRVVIALAFVGLIMFMNLRGLKESGNVFAVPTFFFLAMMVLMLGVGLVQLLSGSLGTVSDPPPMAHLGTAAVTLFLVLHAFSSGTTALTGIEAISDGIPAFREPRSRNAATTLAVMSTILAFLFVGITVLTIQTQAVPSEAETVISQVARTIFDGRGPLYLAVITATTVILIMAANTAFADFPRLSSIIARDGYLPRQLTYRGSRLVFSRGILALSAAAGSLIIIFQASVTALIPLYAIGVFLSFTLSQSGMARRWRKSGHLAVGEVLTEAGSTLEHDPHWRMKMWLNGFGAVLTFLVMLSFAATKFADGAWVVLVIIPALVMIFLAIHRHYRDLAEDLSLEAYGAPPRMTRHRVIVPVSGVHRGTLAALEYARSLSPDITAVHVSTDPDDAQRVRRKWSAWGDGVRLVTLESPYRLLMEPLLEYIEEIAALRQPNEVITVVVPQFVPHRWWHNLLHTQTALVLNLALRGVEGVVITDVPYQVGDE
jgi:amino acid transporter